MSDIAQKHCDSMPRDRHGLIDCRPCPAKVREACTAHIPWSAEAHVEHMKRVEALIDEQ